MTAPAALSLRQFVAAHLDDGVTDFHGAAESLVGKMPDSDRDLYLTQALIPIIGEITGNRRRAAFDDAPADTGGGDHRCDDDHGTAEPAPGGPNLARQNAHREYWANLLNSVGLAADGGRKRVGDMTAADLRANIDYRERLARENMHRADQFRDLLTRLESQGAEVVSDIDLEAAA